MTCFRFVIVLMFVLVSPNILTPKTIHNPQSSYNFSSTYTHKEHTNLATSPIDISTTPSLDLNIPNALDFLAYSNQWRALLHFKGKTSLIGIKSGFFLSQNGHKNPLDELKESIKKMSDSSELDKGEESVFCTYPARAMFLGRYIANIKENMRKAKCEGFLEFKEIVPIEDVFLGFAGESEIYPGSAMGHIFLILQGEAKKDIYKEVEHKKLKGGGEVSSVVDIKKGDKQSFAVSFFATTELGINPIPYFKAMFGNLSGIYSLSPLDNVEFEYLENEKRSIWRLKLIMSEEEKALLRAHLWELRNVPIDYAFINHNCNDALKLLLRVVNEDFYTPQTKPYQTPTEYLKSLKKANKIIQTSIQTPLTKQSFIKKYGANEILHTRNSSKFSISYINQHKASLLSMQFAPIYSSIKNATNAYKEHTESRLLGFEVRHNIQNNSSFINNIEILHLFSAPDTFRTKRFVKYFNASFINPLWENSKTAIKPNVSFGMGVGSYMGKFSVFLLPLIGYEYVQKNNGFIDVRVGVIGNFYKLRLLINYDYYWGIATNERRYTHKFSSFIGINIYKQCDIFFQLSYMNYLQTNVIVTQGGLSINF